MYAQSPVDPEGLREYSVVFTERSLNHMSQKFQRVMRDISAMLKQTYNAAAVALVPGGGTYGMEAIARQFAGGAKCLVIRDGYFSYRWSQVFDLGQIPRETVVLKATPIAPGPRQPWAPPPLGQVLAAIREHQPDLVFAAHVDTSSGIILPHDYLRSVGEAVRAQGGMFVLDCVASGTVWVDMQDCAVDVLLTAPQKGWSASPCAAIVLLGAAAAEWIKQTRTSRGDTPTMPHCRPTAWSACGRACVRRSRSA
jgi:aspartate aminotransferase-like enzyme